jgi:hypothetical protein
MVHNLLNKDNGARSAPYPATSYSIYQTFPGFKVEIFSKDSSSLISFTDILGGSDDLFE